MHIVQLHFPKITSTQDFAKAHIAEFIREALTVISADEQTAARGRLQDRNWLSPAHQNLYLTFALSKEHRDWAQIPQLLAVTVTKIVQKLGLSPTVKWPNDILLAEKKIGGILTETIPHNGNWLLIGLGLNVNMSRTLLETIDQPATSLSVEYGEKIPLKPLKSQLIKQFHHNLQQFFKTGFTPFFSTLQQVMVLRNKCSLKLPNDPTLLEGQVHSLNPDGSLNFQFKNGEVKKLVSGDLV